MIRCDVHLHTAFSSDSEAPMESMIQKGIDLGLETLCFTDHFDPCYPENPEGLDFLLDFENYKRTLFALKEKYRSKITVLYGIELGAQPQIQRELAYFYEQYGQEYDFIILSTHLINGEDPYDGNYFKHMGVKRGLQVYFETILSNLRVFPHYQTVGHLDYACRFLPKDSAPFSYEEFQEILDEILREIISQNRGLEINTSGFRYGLVHPNPHPSILKRYRELGGEIVTIGSDAHQPEHMAWDFCKLPDFLKECGFNRYAVFQEKQPVFYDL